jgi:hypothetical protein
MVDIVFVDRGLKAKGDFEVTFVDYMTFVSLFSQALYSLAAG